MTELVNWVVQGLVVVGEQWLMPGILVVFGAAVVARVFVYWTVRGQFGFAKEFETRVQRYLDNEYPELAPGPDQRDFHELTEALLRRTHHEVFELRATHLRRKRDRSGSVVDRLLGIEEGAKRVIQDTTRQTRYFKSGDLPPSFDDVARHVFLANPYFNRLLGLAPIGLVNDVLNLLPGLFVAAGVFHAFLGIALALPEFKALDPSDFAAAKLALDAVFARVGVAMNASILGIASAVVLSLLNTLLSPASKVVGMTDKFKLSLEFLWNDVGRARSAARAPRVPTPPPAFAYGEEPDFPRPLSLSREPEVTSVVRRPPPPPERERSIEFSMAARLLKDRLASKARRGSDSGAA